MDAYAFEDKFSEEELEAYKEGFKFFDKRNDGTIDNENLPLAFRSMGLLVSGDEIKAFLKRFDPDNNGSIDQNDYLTYKFSSLSY
jgi:Ca2+-binding EF-hand superfamily protein